MQPRDETRLDNAIEFLFYIKIRLQSLRRIPASLVLATQDGGGWGEVGLSESSRPAIGHYGANRMWVEKPLNVTRQPAAYLRAALNVSCSRLSNCTVNVVCTRLARSRIGDVTTPQLVHCSNIVRDINLLKKRPKCVWTIHEICGRFTTPLDILKACKGPRKIILMSEGGDYLSLH